jgi:hypothetical protein
LPHQIQISQCATTSQQKVTAPLTRNTSSYGAPSPRVRPVMYAASDLQLLRPDLLPAIGDLKIVIPVRIVAA